MLFRLCPLGCGRYLSSEDGHDRCLQCQGIQHAEAAFVGDSCAGCGRMSMASLQSRLSFVKIVEPSAATRLSGSSRGPPAGALGDLRVTVRASPLAEFPRTSYSSRSECPIRLPSDFAGPARGAASISFGVPPEDQMSITASGDGLSSSEDEGSAGLPPRVLWPPPNRTRSWWPCLPGLPWASGWRSTDRLVPSPRGWMIGFSERDAAHNRNLLRCLSSRRCMRGRQGVHGHSPGGESGCGAPVPAKRRNLEESSASPGPKPVNWRPLSRPKLTVLRARMPLPCMPSLKTSLYWPFTGPLRARAPSGLPAQGPWEYAHWQNVGPLALALHGQPSLSPQEALTRPTQGLQC